MSLIMDCICRDGSVPRFIQLIIDLYGTSIVTAVDGNRQTPLEVLMKKVRIKFVNFIQKLLKQITIIFNIIIIQMMR